MGIQLPYQLVSEMEDVQANFEALRFAVGGTRGTATVTFTAATVSNTVTATHGLGVLPVAVFFSPMQDVSVAVSASNQLSNMTANTLTFRAFAASALSTTVEFAWMAVV